MGRKSAKSKDKRQKRKEEGARLAEKQAVIDAANDIVDPLSLFAPFRKYERNGLSLAIGSHRRQDMDEETLDFAFQITKKNMESLYEQSDWGWSDKSKREEMSEEKARYLIARTQEGKPVAAVHFRFDLDCDDIVLYCYEIQLIKEVRGKGLGKFLMQILELLAHKTNMSKLMLTVFTQNHDSHNFFKKKLGYETDETSPEENMVEALYDEEGYCYQILSKPISAGKKKSPLSPTHTNGQTTSTHTHGGSCCSPKGASACGC